MRCVTLPVGPAVVAFLVSACSGATKDNDFQTDCSSSTPVALAVGASVVLDATQNGGCLELPAAGAGGAEYLVVAVAASSQETQNGVSGPYTMTGAEVAAAPAPALAARRAGTGRRSPADAFHLSLRERERELSRDPALRVPSVARAAAVPPNVGDQRTFKVCSTTSCSGFVDVAATAAFVGTRGAIYLDNTVPNGGYTQGDLDALGALFDGPSPNMYEIDTTAFGAESDLDGNGVVIILLTDQVNALSGNCNQSGSVILGYFFGLDLTSGNNSNNGEVFYGLVPNPGGNNCTISKSFALGSLPPTFIHEFQHMISFNQHFLVRGGSSEQTWLNEGLSHFAEELGGRLLNDAQCPAFSSCLSQFASGDISNAFEYLLDPESHFLVYPGSSFGTLEERGASWLFVRWLADHFASTATLGTDLTRGLVRTNRVGAANAAFVTGQSFPDLVARWQLANFAEGVVGFTDQTGQLRYTSWDFRTVYTQNAFPRPYPLVPDASTGSYSRSGTLRAGSGHHLRIQQAANAAPVSVQVTGNSSFGNLTPRWGVLRLQ